MFSCQLQVLEPKQPTQHSQGVWESMPGGHAHAQHASMPQQRARSSTVTATAPHPWTGAGVFTQERAATPQSAGWFKFLIWEGGTTWDAFFTCASAQVRVLALLAPLACPAPLNIDEWLPAALPVPGQTRKAECWKRELPVAALLVTGALGPCLSMQRLQNSVHLSQPEPCSCCRLSKCAGGPGHPLAAPLPLPDRHGGRCVQLVGSQWLPAAPCLWKRQLRLHFALASCTCTAYNRGTNFRALLYTSICPITCANAPDTDVHIPAPCIQASS